MPRSNKRRVASSAARLASIPSRSALACAIRPASSARFRTRAATTISSAILRAPGVGRTMSVAPSHFSLGAFLERVLGRWWNPAALLSSASRTGYRFRSLGRTPREVSLLHNGAKAHRNAHMKCRHVRSCRARPRAALIFCVILLRRSPKVGMTPPGFDRTTAKIAAWHVLAYLRRDAALVVLDLDRLGHLGPDLIALIGKRRPVSQACRASTSG